MSKNKLGQFMMGNSLIHRLDPRAKIIGLFFVILSAIISSSFTVALFNMFLLVLAIKLSAIHALKFFRRMKALLILFAFTFFFQAILTRGDVLLQAGGIHVTRQGILLGFVTILRLLVIYLCSTLITTTTSPMKLTSGLESIFAPLQVIKVPVNQLSMITSISLRFIPTIIEETENIKNAQKSRGAQFESRKLLVRLRCMTAVLIPVLAASLQRAGDLATAMESRCYTAETSIRHTAGLHFTLRDAAAVLVTAIGPGLCLFNLK